MTARQGSARNAVPLGLILLLATLARPALAIDTEPPLPDPRLQARYEALTHELRCVQCQNQTIADSEAALAGDLRRQVREMLADGRSDEEVRRFMTDRYGDFVLYQPPLRARTYLLWAAPLVLLAIGLGSVAVVIAGRARRPFEAEPGPDGTDEAHDR